ncbi:hypothetical protein DCE79_05120 [Lysinibacillus sp. 2017]|uniref:hypothetical protein n=1 Tax=unclassified Lysinibacillus TaxID=2636778 RepID=UPI000D525EC7|nr:MULTISPECIES: hypothetical protein [unclassified Lysinibacillus]AWE06813.1 hypothetical protein DCE79_05120 [Lysinibacillus sp. 2017]TGN37255.1 hypothetical protein E4L99_01875 [Lysinibacillus sp. S2017]
MSNPKKQIIMNEITFWKQNKLLPEHYCDFLMTLYSEGNNEPESIGNAKNAVHSVEKRRKWGIATFFPIIAAIIILLLFTIQYEWVVIAIAAIFAVSCLMGAIYFAKKNNLLATMLQLATALAALGITLKICTAYFAGNNVMLYTLLIVNCVFWLLSGIIMKTIYFTISGVLGLIVIISAWIYFL